MKIRSGFVSNSSTSSFLIYGISLDRDDVLETHAKMFPDGEEDIPGYEAIEKILEKADCVGFWDDDYTYYVGCSWDSIQDDETGKQFKARIQKDIDAIFGEGKFKCSSLEGTYPC